MRTSLNLLQNTLCHPSHTVQKKKEETKEKNQFDALSLEFHLSEEFGHRLSEFRIISNPYKMEPTRENSEGTQANRLIKFGMRLGVSAALHPFEYSKVLIQVCDYHCE